MQPTDVEVGTTLASRYLLERLIEHVPARAAESNDTDSANPAGRSAQTWYARDSVLSRPVVVVMLDASDERSSRLLEAARRAATATDVRFLRVLDAASEDGVAYVVKEWVTGRSLAELLGNGPLPAQQAGWIVRDVAEAVTNVHSQGAAHLRLDPDNVILTDSGTVRIEGLATDAVLRGATTASEHDATDVDTRALGRLLYAALTARWPGEPHPSLRPAPRSGDGTALSPRQCRAGVPRSLDEITIRILADRPPHPNPLISPLEVTAALTDAVGTTPPDASFVAPAGDQEHRFPGSPAGDANGRSSTAAATAAWAPHDDRATAPIRQDTGAGPPASGPPAGGSGWPDDQRTEAFASATPHAAGQDSQARGSAAGAAGPPASGGPPPRQHTVFAAAPQPRRSSPWRRVLSVVAAVLFLGGAAFLGWQLAFQGIGSDDPTGEQAQSGEEGDEDAEQSQAAGGPDPGTPYEVVDGSDFDPQGTGEEYPEDVPHVYDGDPDTMWTTMEYRNYSELGLLKDGVGVWLDLGEPRKVGNVEATLRNGGTAIEARAAPPDATEPPSDIDGWERFANADNAGSNANLRPEETVNTRYILLWLTDLPPSEGGFRGGVSEVLVSR